MVEVTDPDDALAGLIASTSMPILSIEAGWAGRYTHVRLTVPGVTHVRRLRQVASPPTTA